MSCEMLERVRIEMGDGKTLSRFSLGQSGIRLVFVSSLSTPR